MTAILGLSAYYHDSAACLLVDGKIVAAAQEERFTRKKHDAGLPAERGALVPEGRRTAAREARPRRLLRQAAREVRAALRDLPRVRPARLRVVPQGDAPLDLGPALDERADREGPRLGGQGPLRRPPRVARGLRVLPVSVRGGRGPHDGRRGGVGDVLDRLRPRERARHDLRDAVPALDRAPLLGVHVLLRLQGEQRRVQAHGPRALRRAEVRGPDPRKARPCLRGRVDPAEHGVLHVRDRPHDDGGRVRAPLRRARARGRVEAHAARDGSRRARSRT